MVEKLKSWSYSRYSCYTECPAKAKYKFIDKLPEPPAPAMDRGDRIHKLAEAYVSGTMSVMPEELKLFEDQFVELREAEPYTEDTWAFTSAWDETKWNDWNKCAVRIKVDAACIDKDTLYVIDYKTGKKRDGYDEQLSLYALGGFLKFPKVKTVETQLWYLDSGDQVIDSYSMSETKALMSTWNKRVIPLLSDTTFKPKPSNGCRFCNFSKSKGGPCKY